MQKNEGNIDRIVRVVVAIAAFAGAGAVGLGSVGGIVLLAVGVIMGGAFGKIVSSLVADVLTPPIGYLTGGIKFEELAYKFPKMTVGGLDLDPPTINYGKFLQASFDFVIVAICIFILVKAMNTVMKKKAEAPKPPEPSPSEKLLTEIRDLLKAQPGR